MKKLILILLLIILSIHSKSQVLVEVLGATGCYFCPFALKSAHEIVGNTIIVYWSDDRDKGEKYNEIIRSRRKHYNIYAYPTTWFNSRKNFVGGGDGLYSVTRDFQRIYDSVKNDQKKYDISIEEYRNTISVYLNGGDGGNFWFVVKTLGSDKPSFIDNFVITPGSEYYSYQIKPGDKEIITWVENESGTLGVANYIRDISSVPSIVQNEIEIRGRDIIFNGKLVVYDIYGRKIGEFVGGKILASDLPKGVLLLKINDNVKRILNEI